MTLILTVTAREFLGTGAQAAAELGDGHVISNTTLSQVHPRYALREKARSGVWSLPVTGSEPVTASECPLERGFTVPMAPMWPWPSFF